MGCLWAAQLVEGKTVEGTNMKGEARHTNEGNTSRRKFLRVTAGTVVAASGLTVFGHGSVLPTRGVEDPGIYVCPPCGQECDKLEFDKPGKCPACGMVLIEKSERDRMAAIAAQASKSPLVGSWAGTYFVGSPEHTAVRFSFTSTDKRLKGTVDLPGQNGGFNLDRLETSENGFSGEMTFIGTKTSFKAELDGSRLNGHNTIGNRTGRLELIRVMPLPLEAMRPWEGLYRAGSSTYLFESVNEAYPCGSVEVSSGSIRSLSPVAPNQFIAGPTLLEALPEEQRFTFSLSAAGRKVTIEQDNTQVTATQAALRSEEVKFQNGDVTLAGTLILPSTRGPHPALIFMHGSGAAPRVSFFGYGYLLASLGIAVLKYDKRGAGRSTGAFTTYEDLAEDAVAGARMLQGHPDIDQKKIGFWGISEGGWTAPEAASRFSEAAFVIVVSGGGLTPAEGELHDSEDELRSDGRFSEADVQQALGFQRARDHYAQTRQGWDDYSRLLKIAVSAPWYNYPSTDLYGASTADSPFWKNKARTYFYDPLPALRRIRCPFLAVRGAVDDPLGGKLAMAAMRKALAEAGNRDVTFHVIPHADHNLFDAKTGNSAELPRAERIAPYAFPLMTNWLQTRLLKNPGRGHF